MTSSTSGIEHDPAPDLAADGGQLLPAGPLCLIAAELHDQTDSHAELLHERQWLLHPSEGEVEFRGNAFALENTLTGDGTVWLKLAPLPHARAHQTDWDVRIKKGYKLFLNRDDPYRWVSRPYSGGKWGRIGAAHTLQRELRPFHNARDARLITNTWGDRGGMLILARSSWSAR